MSEEVDEFLAHYGVIGMKWGVRKLHKLSSQAKGVKFEPRNNLQGKIKPGTIAKKSNVAFNDRPQGYNGAYSGKPGALGKVYRKAAPKIRTEVRRLNKSETYKGKNLKVDAAATKKYHEEVSQIVNKQLNASSALYGNSPRNRYRLKFEYNLSDSIFPKATITVGLPRAQRKEAKKQARQDRRLWHDEENFEEYELTIKRDDKGFILDLLLPDTEIRMSDLDEIDVEDFLAHYGVKGMKWGVRKERKPAPPAVAARIAAKKAENNTGISITRRGMTTQQMAAANAKRKQAEAKTAAKAADKQAKLQKKAVDKNPDKETVSVKKLSDAELQAAIQRIQLERQYAQMVRVEPKTDYGKKLRQALAEAAIKGAAGGAELVIKNAIGSYGGGVLVKTIDSKSEYLKSAKEYGKKDSSQGGQQNQQSQQSQQNKNNQQNKNKK